MKSVLLPCTAWKNFCASIFHRPKSPYFCTGLQRQNINAESPEAQEPSLRVFFFPATCIILHTLNPSTHVSKHAFWWDRLAYFPTSNMSQGLTSLLEGTNVWDQQCSSVYVHISVLSACACLLFTRLLGAGCSTLARGFFSHTGPGIHPILTIM